MDKDMLIKYVKNLHRDTKKDKTNFYFNSYFTDALDVYVEERYKLELMYRKNSVESECSSFENLIHGLKQELNIYKPMLESMQKTILKFWATQEHPDGEKCPECEKVLPEHNTPYCGIGLALQGDAWNKHRDIVNQMIDVHIDSIPEYLKI